MILLHGTTRLRAERIVRQGPDGRYREPGGQRHADGFSTYVEGGPFRFGTPQGYAEGKAKQYPDEGGPVILKLDVPDEIVLLAADEFYPLSQGLVQFDFGSGFEELLLAWPAVARTAAVRGLT